MSSITAWPRRSLATVLVVALVTGGCAGARSAGPAGSVGASSTSVPATDRAPSATPNEPSPSPAVGSDVGDAWLVVGRTGDESLRVILASTAETLADLPVGVPDTTWGRLVTATSDGATTVVADRTVEPAASDGSRTIRGPWRLPVIGADPIPGGVSADGRTIVLVPADDAGTASARAESRFAIVQRPFANEPQIVTLPGAFDFDAISADGSILYVIEHLPGPPDAHYQVRVVDVATGRLREGAVADKNLLAEAMGGYPISQLRRPDGMVFTLYRGAEHPFIHALSTLDAWALCIDLPTTDDDDAAAALDWGLAASLDGKTMVAANATLGIATRISMTDLRVGATAVFAPTAAGDSSVVLAKFGHQAPGMTGRRTVIAGGGAVYVAGRHGIVRMATADLVVDRRYLDGTVVDALALLPDGRTMYALTSPGGQIVKIDTTTGRALGTVPGGGYDRLVAIIPR
jgi:hypothetical protein